MNNDVVFTGIRIKDDVLDGTVADGEWMYIKKYQKWMFLIFDCMFNA